MAQIRQLLSGARSVLRHHSSDRRVDLLALPEGVPKLRRSVREYLGVPCADVELGVTELVGNAILHVGEEGTPVQGRVARAGVVNGTRCQRTAQ